MALAVAEAALATGEVRAGQGVVQDMAPGRLQVVWEECGLGSLEVLVAMHWAVEEEDMAARQGLEVAVCQGLVVAVGLEVAECDLEEGHQEVRHHSQEHRDDEC